MPVQGEEIDARLQAYLDARISEASGWQEIETSVRHRSGSQTAYTPREILQQPWVWQESAAMVAEKMDRLAEIVDKVSHIYLTGAGSSYYVGKCLEIPLRIRLRRPVFAVPTTDLILSPERYLDSSARGLVISFSRSGRSPESFEVERAVRSSFPGYQQLLITCDPDSELSVHFSKIPNGSALSVHPASCDKGLAMTSSFTSMVIAGQALAFLGQREQYLEHVKELANLAAHVLARAIDAISGAKSNGIRRACILGSGALYGAALEGALKILELSDGQIPTLAETYLGVRHGPLSFVDSHTLVVYLVSSHPTARKYEKDLMQELRNKHLGIRQLAVGCRLSELHGLFEGIDLPCPSNPIPDDLRPPLDVILPQVLALRMSLAAGLNPDNPSNRGAISRVVQGVTIHADR